MSVAARMLLLSSCDAARRGDREHVGVARPSAENIVQGMAIVSAFQPNIPLAEAASGWAPDTSRLRLRCSPPSSLACSARQGCRRKVAGVSSS
eukprot:382113-Prymnesium_polylepis.1